MVRDTDNLHFTVGLLCRFSTGSNTYVSAQVAISGLFTDLCMQCRKHPRMYMQSFARNQSCVLAAEDVFAVRLVLRLSPGPDQPFCHMQPL